MIFIGLIRQLIYKDRYNRLLEKRRVKPLNLADLSERDINALVAYNVIRPSKYNGYNTDNDVVFLLQMKETGKRSDGQKTKAELMIKKINRVLDSGRIYKE